MNTNQQGSTLTGFIFGLVLGLAIAVVVAFYINKGANPFTAPAIPKAAEPANRNKTANGETDELPDPNAPLLARTAKPQTAEAPALGTEKAPPPSPSNQRTSGTTTEKPAEIAATIFVQAGAFSTQQEADNQRAKLAFAGFEAKVYKADVGGKPMHRVRLGPFTREEEANQLRIKLLEAGLESTIVR
ncbi:SPOR domain-containing protein [Parvibium lacunae]|uniref:SPOR domain-containing protein n=1 Tax=Parvibium lacunae TaxID=1888893 RepID=A0A368L0X7_9BURK|nr:SPOR domain-containing protein [Parvibium lacunae]RCS57095.1 hypothetical protein DU000_09840 [Parvibium lacunae]